MERQVAVAKERPIVRVKPYIIFSNAVIGAALAATGMLGMVFTDRVSGVIFEWATLVWVLGLVSLFFIPLEICLIRPSREKASL